MKKKILIIGSDVIATTISELLYKLNFEVVVAKQNYNDNTEKNTTSNAKSFYSFKEQNCILNDDCRASFVRIKEPNETFEIIIVAEKSERLYPITHYVYAHSIKETIIIHVDTAEKSFKDNNLSQTSTQKSKTACRRYLKDVNSKAIAPLLEDRRLIASINITYLKDTLKIIKALEDLRPKSKAVWRASD